MRRCQDQDLPLYELNRRALLLGAASVCVTLIGAPAAAKSRTRVGKLDDPSLANVTFAGFRPLSDGRSLVYVEISSKVPVRLERKPGFLVYELSGARVALPNNRNPLVTTAFASSLDSARLRESKASSARSVELVLKLRADVTPTHTFAERATGAVLEVTLPALPRGS